VADAAAERDPDGNLAVEERVAPLHRDGLLARDDGARHLVAFHVEAARAREGGEQGCGQR